MADWFAQNAPAAQAPPSGNWFASNAPREAPAEPKSNLQRFAQSWWDHSVLKHPIDSAVGLVKSLVTMPDYHTLTPEEKAHVDGQVEKAFHEAAHPTPELAGQVASTGTNAAIITGATMGLAKGLGAVVDNADVIKGAASGAGKAIIEPVKYGHLKLPIPAPAAGAAAGGYAASQVGLPHQLGAVIGAGIPIVKGAIKGGRAALATRIAKAAGEDKILAPDIAASMLESLNEDDAVFHPPAQAAPVTPVIAPSAAPESPFTPAGPVRPPLASQPVAAAPAAEPAPALTPKTDLEDLLERSLKDPVISRAAVTELDEHLKAEGLKKTGEIIDKNQTRRALKLGRFLQSHGMTTEHVSGLTPAEWHEIGGPDMADVPKPSATTIQKTIDLMRMAEENTPQAGAAGAGR